MVYQTREREWGWEHRWKLPTCTCLRHFIFLVFYRYKDMVPQTARILDWVVGQNDS